MGAYPGVGTCPGYYGNTIQVVHKHMKVQTVLHLSYLIITDAWLLLYHYSSRGNVKWGRFVDISSLVVW